MNFSSVHVTCSVCGADYWERIDPGDVVTHTHWLKSTGRGTS